MEEKYHPHVDDADYDSLNSTAKGAFTKEKNKFQGKRNKAGELVQEATVRIKATKGLLGMQSESNCEGRSSDQGYGCVPVEDRMR